MTRRSRCGSTPTRRGTRFAFLSADQPLTSVGWIAAIAESLTAMQHLVREAVGQGHDAADPAALAAQVRLFRSAALAGASQTAARSGALMKKHNALARRLRDRQDDYLRFTQDWRIPPDNNGCERDIRMTKLSETESIRLPAHPDRRPPVLRDTKLPLYRRQARSRLLQRARHAHRRTAVDTRRSLIPCQCGT